MDGKFEHSKVQQRAKHSLLVAYMSLHAPLLTAKALQAWLLSQLACQPLMTEQTAVIVLGCVKGG